MSIPYELSGRTRQKQRTRGALVQAARELVTGGQTPTVDAAAARASVSRTTAYRYFPNQRALLVAAHPEIEARSLLPETAPSDVAARLDAVVTAFLHLIVDTEAQQRTMLRLSLDPDPSHRGQLPLRKGRAIAWIGEALSPLRGVMAEERTIDFAKLAKREQPLRFPEPAGIDGTELLDQDSRPLTVDLHFRPE